MSEHKEPKPVSGIVTSDAVQAAHRKHGFLHVLSGPLGLLSGILIIILIGGSIFLWHKSSQQKQSSGQKPVSAHEQQVIKSQQTVYQTQTQQALSQAQAAVTADKNATTPAQKVTLANDYLSLGQAYMNTKDYGDAITAYNNALNTDPSAKRQALNGLFSAYLSNGQKAEAIKVGNELIAYLQSLEPTDDSVGPSIQSYQRQIKALQG